jgi:HPt (histidine-containing phosphotransfer) domain-containing protein
MQDVEQQCLAVGMNDYLSKPVNYSQLLNVLSKNMQLNGQNINEEIPSFIPDENDLALDKTIELPGIDQSIARQFLGDDKDQLKKVLIQFREQYSQVYEQMNDYVEKKNYSEAHLLAHSLKGVSSIMGAKMLSEASLTLEKYFLMDVSNDDELKENMQQFKQQLDQIIRSSYIL